MADTTNLVGQLDASPTRVFQSPDQRRTELLADLVAAAWGTHGEFVDADQFVTKSTVLRRLASLLAERVPEDVDRLLGREPHSLVLATAVALETGLPLVIARLTGGGSELGIFGELHPEERVLIVEGVTGTGASAANAGALAQAQGATIAGVLAAVDRGTGAAHRLHEAGFELTSLFHDDELRAVARRTGLSQGRAQR